MAFRQSAAHRLVAIGDDDDPTHHGAFKPARESRTSRLRRQFSFRSKPPAPPPRHFKRDFASRKYLHAKNWNQTRSEWRELVVTLIAPLFVLGARSAGPSPR